MLQWHNPFSQPFPSRFTPKSVVKAGSEVRLRITLTNTSDQDAFYSVVAQSAAPYDVYVRDSKGNSAPETPYGRKIHPWSPGHPPLSGSFTAFRVRLAPGRKTETEVDLTREYNLSQPGKYAVQSQDVQDGIVLKSNTLTVTVTE